MCSLAVSASSKKGPVIKTSPSVHELNVMEKKVLNLLQKDFGFDESPYAKLAEKLEISEAELLGLLASLKDRGFISRIGPFFNMDRSTVYVSLVAMKVSEDRFDEVAALVNSYTEVAHNYKRKHEFNMWFVIATHAPVHAQKILEEIEIKTQIKTFNLPKLQEFSLDLFLEV